MVCGLTPRGCTRECHIDNGAYEPYWCHDTIKQYKVNDACARAEAPLGEFDAIPDDEKTEPEKDIRKDSHKIRIKKE